MRRLKFFKKFNIVHNSQHGFVKGKNTETAIFELTLIIVLELERDEIPAVLFLDLYKAFDYVNLEMLFNNGTMWNKR